MALTEGDSRMFPASEALLTCLNQHIDNFITDGEAYTKDTNNSTLNVEPTR